MENFAKVCSNAAAVALEHRFCEGGIAVSVIILGFYKIISLTMYIVFLV